MYEVIDCRSAGPAAADDPVTRMRLVLPCAGAGARLSIDGAMLELAPGEALVIGADRGLSVSSDERAFALEITTCDPEEADRLVAVRGDGTRAKRLPLDRSLRLMRDLLLVSPDALADPRAAHAWASLAIHTIANAAPPWPRSVRAAVDHVEARLHEPLSVEAMAAAGAVSRRTLHDLFLRHLGVSPYAFVSSRRIERALELLVEKPDLSIAAIAHTTGHKDQSALTRAVRTRLGTTPGEYRRRHRITADPDDRLHGRKSNDCGATVMER